MEVQQAEREINPAVIRKVARVKSYSVVFRITVFMWLRLKNNKKNADYGWETGNEERRAIHQTQPRPGTGCTGAAPVAITAAARGLCSSQSFSYPVPNSVFEHLPLCDKMHQNKKQRAMFA